MMRMHLKSKSKTRKHSRRNNMYACFLAMFAVGFLYMNSQQMIAGGDPAGSFNQASLLSMPSAPPTSGGDGKGGVSNVMTGSMALDLQIAMLKNGLAKMEKTPEYTAIFSKQECVKGTLRKKEVMQLKIRHAPFSVYMKWAIGDKGREVLYVDGKNKGRMLVHLGGMMNVVPTVKLDPNSAAAMKESRYPVTKAGLAELIRSTLEIRNRDIENKESVCCEIFGGQKFNKRDCFCIVTTYDSQEYSDVYRKTVMYMDSELMLPVCVQNYRWAEEGEEADDSKTLIESYTYTKLKMRPALTNVAFERGNKNYYFK